MLHTRIADDHAALRSLLIDFTAKLGQPASGDGAILGDRVVFARTFRSYLSNLNDAAQALAPLAGEAQAAAARSSIEAVRSIQRDYGDHVRRWAPHDIASNSSSYRAAIATLEARLLVEIDRLERHLLPLLRKVPA